MGFLGKLLRPDKWFSDGTIMDKILEPSKYVNPDYYFGEDGLSGALGLSDDFRAGAALSVLGGLGASGALTAGAAGTAAAGSVSGNLNDGLTATITKKAKDPYLLPFVGSALGAGSSLAAAGISSSAAQKLNEQQYAQNLALAQYNNAAQYEYWNKQFDKITAYESPAAQMSRLLQAGINPYASTGISAGSAPSAAPYIPAESPILQSSGAAAAPYIANAIQSAASMFQKVGAADMALDSYKIERHNKKLAAQVQDKLLQIDNASLDDETMDNLITAKRYAAAGQKDEAYRIMKIASERASSNILANELKVLVNNSFIEAVETDSLFDYTIKYYDRLCETYFQASIAQNEYSATEVKKDVNSEIHKIIEQIKSSDINDTFKSIIITLVAGFGSRLSAGSLPVPSIVKH